MKQRAQYLTKSRFKIGHDCPNKLYFVSKPEYPSTMQNNDFLKALAEGGFQVGEFAKVYHPEGISVETQDKVEAIRQTNELMKKDRVTIFEGAFSVGPFFIRVDLIEKFGNAIKLTEVKSKTFDPEEFHEQGFFTKKRTGLISTWEPYLIDVAFQTFVFKKAFPDFTVTSALMLMDKSQEATVDELNQKFLILPENKTNKRVKITGNLTKETAGKPLLANLCVDDEVKFLFSQSYGEKNLNFEKYALELAGIYEADKFPNSPVSRGCKGCEYRIGDELKSEEAKSGFEYCFIKMENLKALDCAQPFVFDLHYVEDRADELMAQKKFLIKDLIESDIEEKEKPDGRGWSRTNRQVLQIKSYSGTNQKVWAKTNELREVIDEWNYPLHFIDFETSRAAIPFHKGFHPYSQVAFQFSHHKVTKEGKITHETQYLNVERGKFPNFDFARALYNALKNDAGTVFQYWPHENSVLNEIRGQLIARSSEVSDAAELITFIESITKRKENKTEIAGARNMVDLCDLVGRYYFHKDMGGRTSIKKVLPAILNVSSYLQIKYSNSLSELGISSLSLGNYKLADIKNGKVLDPYKNLKPVFDDIEIKSDPDEDGIIIDGKLQDGGAAMIAYARMQFSEMTSKQHKEVSEALLRYCELDTLAMVLIWDYWVNDLLKQA